MYAKYYTRAEGINKSTIQLFSAKIFNETTWKSDKMCKIVVRKWDALNSHKLDKITNNKQHLFFLSRKGSVTQLGMDSNFINVVQFD